MGIKDMTGIQKAAALLISLGVEKAANVLKVMDQKTMEKLTFEINDTRDVDYDTKRELMQEFHDLMLTKKFSLRGGSDYARNLLVEALGADDSNKMLDRINTVAQENPFEFMDQADPEQLLDLLKNEHPQTISLILAHLTPEKSGQIVKGLDSNIQLDVIKRISSMENIAPEVLELLYTSLQTTISSLLDVSASKIGGTKLTAEILNRVDTTVEQQLMDRLEQEDPELAKEIKDLMFVFDDLKYVDDRGIQKVIAAINMDLDLITFALKAASDDLKEKFLEKLSPTARGAVEADMRDLTISLKEALDAQTEILNAATELIKSGDIVVDRSGGQESVML